jgi:hypothetical protein
VPLPHFYFYLSTEQGVRILSKRKQNRERERARESKLVSLVGRQAGKDILIPIPHACISFYGILYCNNPFNNTAGFLVEKDLILSNKKEA